MAIRIVRRHFVLIGTVVVFLFGAYFGSTFNRRIRSPCVIYSDTLLTDKKLIKELKPIEQEALKSFSFAYNVTHLWSLRLPDEKYYRMARLLPCRTANYSGGPKMDSMNSCDQSTFDEFSVERTLHAQKWLYEHQHPSDCTNKRFAIINYYAWSGFGSTVHQILWAFGTALGENRIAVYETPGNWLYGACRFGNPDCLFLPISNCSVPSTIDGNQTIRIKANLDHWIRPIHPPIFKDRSFNWYRSQLLFYLMRYNPETLAHVQHAISQAFKPPAVDYHRPYIAVYVRRSDKVAGREMTQAYPLQHYFDLFDKDARRAKIRTVYINSEDETVFSEFNQVNKNKNGYYKLLTINATRNIMFLSMVSQSVEQREKYVLEFLTDLFIEVNADLHAGTLTSNWCRLVDEIKLTLGKMIAYYTPENRFIIDI